VAIFHRIVLHSHPENRSNNHQALAALSENQPTASLMDTKAMMEREIV
jgi:hypothetical protein